MKHALIIPDGAADEPQVSLGNRTPLEAASIPNMDAIVEAGLIGETDNVPASFPSGSDVGTMSLFGYDPQTYHTGRAPLEAAAQGIDLGPEDWAVRCNLVTVEDGQMVSFTAGQIPGETAGQLLELLQKDQCGNAHLKFHAGVSYRNLLVYRARGEPAPFNEATRTVPPHDLLDQPIAGGLPQGPGADLLNHLMDRSRELFAQCDDNQARRQRGELPATQIWLWGEGKAPAMEPFAERFGKTAAVVTAVDLLRGLGRLLGWTVVEVPGATAYLDTDYAAKGRYAVDALRQGFDFVTVHVEAPDEASHEGNAAAKIEALEQIDAHIVAPVHGYLRQQGDYRILVCPDHPTFLRTKTHSHGMCPFALCGSGVEADAFSRYDEPTAGRSNVKFPEGHRLMSRFLGQAVLNSRHEERAEI